MYIKVPTGDLGFKVINGERVPLSKEEKKRDEMYSNDLIRSFIPNGPKDTKIN